MADWNTCFLIVPSKLSIKYAFSAGRTIGVASLAGEATMSEMFPDREPEHVELSVELEIQGSTVAEAKRMATVWPDVFDQIIDGAIGLSTSTERFQIFIDPKSFENFTLLVGASLPVSILLYAQKLETSGHLVRTMHVSSLKLPEA